MEGINTAKPSYHWTDNLLLKIANVVVFSLFLGSGTYAVAGPFDWTNPDGANQTYFTPGPWSFSIFGVIHFLLLGTMIWQFSSTGTKYFVTPMSYRFIALGLISSAWVSLWTSNHYILALIASIALAIVSSESFFTLSTHHSHGKSWIQELLIHLPFSLWHGWSIVLVFINSFAAFGQSNSQPATFWTKFSVFVALALLEIQAAGYAFSSTEGNLGGSIVITWTLFSIFSHQTGSKFIHWSALAFAIISTVNIIKSIYGTSTASNRITLSEESQPILPS